MENSVVNEPRQRPVGLVIIIVLLAIGSFIEVVLGILVMSGGFILNHMAANYGSYAGTRVALLGTMSIVLGEIPLAIGLISFLLVVGLWRLKRWAFWTTVIMEAISLVIYALELANPQAMVGLIVLYMIITVVILFYFFLDPRVREAFRISIG